MLYRHDRVVRKAALPAPLVATLERFCCDIVGESMPGEAAEAAQFIRELRNAEHWLMCDCVVRDDQAPLLAPRMNSRGTVTLVRLGRVAHAESCPWFRLRKPGGAGQVDQDPRRVQGAFLMLEGAENETLASSSDVEYSRVNAGGSGRIPRLGRLLLTALDAGGLNRVATGEFRVAGKSGAVAVDVRSYYQKIDAISDWPIAGDITVADVLGHSLKAVRTVAGMVKRVEPMWPRDTRPQGVIISIADSVDVEKRALIRTAGGEAPTVVEMRSRCHVFGMGGGPYWSLIAIARAPGSKWLEPIACYAHPMLSTGLPIPVDSQLERDALLVLLRQMDYWRAIGLPSISLRKPLLAEHGALGSACPDIELSMEGKGRVLVEVMGRMDDPEYIHRKVGMHDRMRQLAEVRELVVYDPAKEDAVSFARRMTGAMHRLAGSPPRSGGTVTRSRS